MKIATATRNPSRVTGAHFMPPLPETSLVEAITGLETDEQTEMRAEKLAVQQLIH